MDKIRPWLYIGSFHDTHQGGYLTDRSIQAMLLLDENIELHNITTLYLPVQDFSPLKFELLDRGLEFIREQKSLDRTILVACAHGINRSSAYCTAALKNIEGIDLLNALREVQKHRPIAMPIESVWESLCEYYGENISYLDVMRI